MKELSIEDIDLQGVKVVIFDLDGTLYDNSWLPIRLILADPRHMFMLASERRSRRLLKGQEFGDADTFYKTLFTHISTHQNVTYMVAKEWYFGKYMPLTVSILKKHYRAGQFVVQLVEELKKRGILTAVFSDYRCVAEKLEAIGLNPDMFDYLEAAPELGGLKPNRQLFLHLVEVIGVKPEEALFIGDREDTDGNGARAAGIKFLKV